MRVSGTVLVIIAAFVAGLPAAAPPVPVQSGTDALVERVLLSRMTSGFRARATLTVSTSGSAAKQTRQLLIEGRRDHAVTSLLYRQVWPSVDDAPAMVISDPGDHRLHGFVLELGKALPVTDRMAAARFFESDLRFEDLLETFWYWPSRTAVAEEAVGEYRCSVVDFRPAATDVTAYSKVRAWVSPDANLALRLQQFGRDGRLTKTISLHRILRRDGRSWPGIITVEPADGTTRSVVEGAAYDSNLNLPARHFSLAELRKPTR